MERSHLFAGVADELAGAGATRGGELERVLGATPVGRFMASWVKIGFITSGFYCGSMVI